MTIKAPPLDLTNATPAPPGVAAPGTSDRAARGDHVHAAQAVPSAGSATPIIAGAGSAGAATAYAREDHIHPAQSVPALSSTLPAALGVAAIGVATTSARADHVHALPTIPGPSVTTPLAPTAGGAIGSGTTYAKADHQHPPQSIAGLTVGTPNPRSLSLATAYQATDNTKPALVTINLSSTAALSLAGGTTCTADILIGSTNAVAGGTGTILGRYSNTLTGALVIGLAVNSTAITTYSLPLPTGWFFACRSTAGTVTINSAFDQALN